MTMLSHSRKSGMDDWMTDALDPISDALSTMFGQKRLQRRRQEAEAELALLTMQQAQYAAETEEMRSELVTQLKLLRVQVLETIPADDPRFYAIARHLLSTAETSSAVKALVMEIWPESTQSPSKTLK